MRDSGINLTLKCSCSHFRAIETMRQSQPLDLLHTWALHSSLLLQNEVLCHKSREILDYNAVLWVLLDSHADVYSVRRVHHIHDHLYFHDSHKIYSILSPKSEWLREWYRWSNRSNRSITPSWFFIVSSSASFCFSFSCSGCSGWWWWWITHTHTAIYRKCADRSVLFLSHSL